MKTLLFISVLLLFANFVRCSIIEDKKEEIKKESESIKNSTDEVKDAEKSSETYHIPSYALPDSGPYPNPPPPPPPVYPDTPVYSSLYPVKTHDKPPENYVDYDYDNVFSLTHNIPGIPGKDYPVFSSIPLTNFHCRDTGYPGFYADVDSGCQVWHYCQPDGRHDAFLCPNGTIFDQKNRVCNWWYNVNCKDSHYWYAINHDLYRVTKKRHNLEADYYHDHQYLASKIIETKAKPPSEEILSAEKTKLHPAVIVKIPKKHILKPQISASRDKPIIDPSPKKIDTLKGQ
ncbi:uncharacterized protein [Centruroides vittatus]|uniref:uncharacterized protein n=1 Tax=Centruroides vittatus TaxID=120091 RepID=UPI0035107E30